MASVRLDTMLRDYVPRLSLASDMGTIRGVLADLEAQFPRLRLRLRDEAGALRKFVRVYVNGEDISALRGLETKVREDDHIEILHSIQGG
ncbi:MAG: MoaD/ThiS family protein [Thermoplasmata archaeon]